MTDVCFRAKNSSLRFADGRLYASLKEARARYADPKYRPENKQPLKDQLRFFDSLLERIQAGEHPNWN